MPTVLHVSPHADDEAVGCPGVLLHLLDRGWTIVNVVVSLGFDGARDARRAAETLEAAERAGFVPVLLDPPVNLDLDGDLPAAVKRLAHELPILVREHDASVVVSPTPHDVHHGHEAVGRGVEQALAALPSSVRWWMWGVWGDLPAPNMFYGFGQDVMDRALYILEAYGGELERNNYRVPLLGRASANAALGSERVFGFGAPAVGTLPYADLLTEVRLIDGRFMASEPHQLDEGPEPDTRYDLDLTAWVESPSVHDLVGHIPEVRGDGVVRRSWRGRKR
jgi:hypothetical protein